jgi:plastocyanin
MVCRVSFSAGISQMRACLINCLCSTAALAVMACGGDDPAAPPDPSVADVYTLGVIFSPFTTDIDAGGTVRFHITVAPDGDGHNALFDQQLPGAPPDIDIVEDTTVSRVFTTRGTFAYLCTVHPGMAGEVVVH